MITGIIVALADEIPSLIQQKISKGDSVFINDNTLLIFSGAGPENASNASQLLIKKGANRLISWGCSAALDTHLKPGDLIIPKTLSSEKQELISIDSAWLQYVIKHLSTFTPVTGLLIESSSIVAKSADKKLIHQQTGALALDMESIAIAKTAVQHNLPVLIIRTIADPVDMSLPRAVSHALNEKGDIVLSKLFSFLFTHPSELPGLIKLGLHFNSAKNKLKLIAKQLDIIVGFEQNPVVK